MQAIDLLKCKTNSKYKVITLSQFKRKTTANINGWIFASYIINNEKLYGST